MNSKFSFNDGGDFMEIGDTGWVPAGQGSFINKYNGHVLDELGREYDREGNLIYDPEENNDNNN